MNLSAVSTFLGKIYVAVVNPIIVVLFAIAVIMVLWSGFNYVRYSDSDTERVQAQKGMMWGIVGLFIMISVFGILCLVSQTIGVTNPYCP